MSYQQQQPYNQGQPAYGYPQQQQQQQHYGYQQQPQQQYGYQQQPTPQQHQGGKQQPQPVQYQSYTPNNAAGYGAQEPLVVATSHQPHIEHGVPLYPEYDQNNAGGGVNATGGSKFTLQGYKDVWAAVLFVLLTLAIVGVGSYNFKNNFHLPTIVHHNNDPDSRWGEPFYLSTYILCAFLGAVGGLVLGIFSLGIFYCAPTAAIWLANIAIVALFCGIGLGLIVLGANSGITLMLVGAVRLAIVVIYRKTIPLSGMMLQQATIIAKRHPMAIVLSFVTMLLAAVWCAFALATAYPTIRHSWHDSDFSGSVIGMFIFLAFTVYWCTQIAFNLGHVTFCGLTATWYFCGQDSMPSNPTLHSFKRASTTSFGSVCLGSLLIAILRTLRYIFRSMGSNRSFCGCIFMCLLSCLESIMEMFNHFAYVYVAMYGTSYVESAKRTMQLVKTSAYLQLFNNMMIDGTLLMFQLVLSALVGVCAYFITRKWQLDDPANAGRSDYDDDFWVGNSVILALIAGFASLVTTAQIFRVVDSTVTTLLVCLSEEPQMIYSTNPEFGGKLANYLAEQQQAAANARNGNDNQSMTSRV